MTNAACTSKKFRERGAIPPHVILSQLGPLFCFYLLLCPGGLNLSVPGTCIRAVVDGSCFRFDLLILTLSVISQSLLKNRVQLLRCSDKHGAPDGESTTTNSFGSCTIQAENTLIIFKVEKFRMGFNTDHPDCVSLFRLSMVH